MSNFRELFSRDRVVTNNASVQNLVEVEAFVLRVLHVDYVDRVVIHFGLPVLFVPGRLVLVHRVHEGQ